MTVLVAEDHPVNMKIIRFMLEKENCEVFESGNGLEAVKRFRVIHPDLILMDIQMPEMDGLDACREIRKIEAENHLMHTPISALSANASEEDREEAENAGMDHFLSKPVTLEDISGLLGKISGERETPPEKKELCPGFGYDKLLSTFGGNKEIVHSILNDFLEGLPEMLERIDKFNKVEDFVSLERTAHSLKGQTLNLHASEASEAFAALERAAREKNSNELGKYRERCNDVIVNLIEKIREYLD